MLTMERIYHIRYEYFEKDNAYGKFPEQPDSPEKQYQVCRAGGFQFAQTRQAQTPK